MQWVSLLVFTAINHTYCSVFQHQALFSCGIYIHSYYSLTREERPAMYGLKNDQSFVIKEADKGPSVVIWDKKDYFIETEKQLSCKET